MILPLLLLFCAADDVKEIRKTLTLSPQGRVSIDTYKGQIKVTTWDQPQVEVHVRIEGDGWGPVDREQVRNTEIEIDSSADSLRLKTRYPKNFGINWPGNDLPLAKYVIRMPRTAQLRIKDYKSEIEVDGLSASLDIDTYKGDVRILRQNGGTVSVKTYKSEARVEFSKLSDRMSFETYRGSYEVSLPRDARFDLDWNGGRRSTLDSSFSMIRPATANRGDHFHTRVNGGGPAMTLKGYRGVFRLR